LPKSKNENFEDVKPQEIVDKIEENLSETNINNNIETNNLETQSIMDTNKEQELLKRLQSMLDEKDAKEKADSLKNEVKTFISDSVDNNKILGVNLDVLSIGQRNAIKDEVGKDAETLDEARKLLKLTAKVFVDKELELKQKTRLAGLKPTNSFVGKTVEYVTDNKSWLEYFDKLDKAVDNSRNEYRKSKVNNVKEYADVNLDFTNRILSDWDQSNSAELASADREQRQAIKDGWISDAAVVVSNSDFKNQPIIARVIIKQIFQRLTTMQLVQGLGPGKGEKMVTAKDIEHPGQVEVLNPEQEIATLTSKTSNLSIEMTVERGLGYVPKEQLQKEKVDIGEITLDATFTPIRRVNYEVENMRVGDRTNFNRLKVFIETDGTILPREALEQSIGIMISQLKSIVGFKESEPEEMMEDKPREKEVKGESIDPELLKTRIETLDMSPRTVNALANANIRTVGGLVRKKEEDILDIDGLGGKGMQEIKRVLSNYGITLK
jgi:DNA-directed RNA polymerase subunit alpha